MELCPQQVVDEPAGRLVLITLAQCLVLEDQVWQFGMRRFSDGVRARARLRTIVPSPLDGERAWHSRVHAGRSLTEGGREVQQRVRGRDLGLALRRRGLGLLALLPLLLCCAFTLDLLQLTQKLSGVVFIVVLIVIVIPECPLNKQ